MSNKLLVHNCVKWEDYEFIGMQENEYLLATYDEKYIFQFNCNSNKIFIRKPEETIYDKTLTLSTLIAFFGAGSMSDNRPIHRYKDIDENIGISERNGFDYYYQGIRILKYFRPYIGFKLYDNNEIYIEKEDNHGYFEFKLKSHGEYIALYMFYDELMYHNFKNNIKRKHYILIFFLSLMFGMIWINICNVPVELFMIFLLPLSLLLLYLVINLYNIQKRISKFCDFMKEQKEVLLNDDNINWMIQAIETDYIHIRN